MKAKHAKEHKPKITLEELEDEWGNKGFLVEGVLYKTIEEAKLAIHTLIQEEYASRLKKGK